NKQHYNLIELVQAMNLSGAKYAGLAHVCVDARLSSVIDRDFYQSFLDADSGALLGGHEHYDGEEQLTRLVVIKFYCARNNKTTSALVDHPPYRDSHAAGETTATQMKDLLQRTDLNEAVDRDLQHAR